MDRALNSREYSRISAPGNIGRSCEGLDAKLSPLESHSAGSPARSEASISGGPLDRLALYQRPGSVVLLDDDIDFLGMLLMTLPRNWNIKAFSNPHACLNYLQKEPAQWDADLGAHQHIVEQWQAGACRSFPRSCGTGRKVQTDTSSPGSVLWTIRCHKWMDFKHWANFVGGRGIE